jgi:hypothetical protein
MYKVEYKTYTIFLGLIDTKIKQYRFKWWAKLMGWNCNGAPICRFGFMTARLLED